MKTQSSRYENDKLKYQIHVNQDEVVLEFVDHFAVKYHINTSIEQLLQANVLRMYRMERQQMAVKFKLIARNKYCEDQMHSELVSNIRNCLELDYYYFKAFQIQGHLERNKKFLKVCQRPIFKQLFPQITCFIYIASNQQQKQQHGQTGKHRPFQKGQILVFIESKKKDRIKKVTKYLQTYTKQKVVFGLDDYFGKKNIKSSEFSLSQLERIIQKLIIHFEKKFMETGVQTGLNVLNMKAYAPYSNKQRYSGFQGKFGIQFQIEGMFQYLQQFYFNVSKIFKANPILIGQIQSIHLSENNQKNTVNDQLSSIEQTHSTAESTTLFFGSCSAVAVIKFSEHFRQWHQLSKLLKKGMFIISEAKGFTSEQMTILIKQNREVANFMDGDDYTTFIDCQYKAVDQKSFLICCQKDNVDKFISRAFDYLKMNSKVEVWREQFTSEFQIYLFMKLIKPLIEAKYLTVSFSVKKGNLYSLSKQSDLQDVKTELQNQKRKIIKKLVKIPAIRQIQKGQKYNISEDEFLNEIFCREESLTTAYYKFDQKIKIFFKSVNSIKSSHPMLIAIVDKNYKYCDFFINNFQMNSLSTERYSRYGLNDKKQDRLINYSMSKSKYVSQMLVWYVQIDQRNQFNTRKLKRDIEDFVAKFKSQLKLKFIIPHHFEKEYFSRFFIQLFKEFQVQDDTKFKQITIFYETQNVKRLNQNIHICLLKENKPFFTLQTKLYLGPEEIQKIILIEHYSVRFFSEDKNQFLSPLNSFIFNFQKSKKSQQFKVPLFLKKIDQVQVQYLLCLKQNIYYKISKNCKIQRFSFDRNKVLQVFSKVIKHYFSFSQYMVAYMNKEEDQVDNKNLYFWTKSNIESPTQKIKRVSINEVQKLIPKKDSETQIHVKRTDILRKFVIQTHQDFVPQVMKKIFAEY